MVVYLKDINQNFRYIYIYILATNIYIMTSKANMLDPRNWNWQKSEHKVTPKVRSDNDAKIEKLEQEQKLLSQRLNKGVYKTLGDHRTAWEAQNRSFQRIIDHRDKWDEVSSSHPHVNKQREEEATRFMDNAIAIQKKYDNIISKHAQKKGLCGYLSEETCRKGKDCYWFGTENVAGKNVGCYSKIAERIPIGQKQLLKRSKKPKDRYGQALPTLGEGERLIGTMGNPIALRSHLKSRLSGLPEQKSTVETKGVNKGGRKTRKRKRAGRRTRKRKRRKRRKSRRKRKTHRRRKR
jgi:hypothetical protein